MASLLPATVRVSFNASSGHKLIYSSGGSGERAFLIPPMTNALTSSTAPMVTVSPSRLGSWELTLRIFVLSNCWSLWVQLATWPSTTVALVVLISPGREILALMLLSLGKDFIWLLSSIKAAFKLFDHFFWIGKTGLVIMGERGAALLEVHSIAHLP